MNNFHTVGVLDGSNISNDDRVTLGIQKAVANVIGGGAGLSVTTTVTFSKELPANYAVAVTPNQDATAYVTNRTSTGFDVVLSPRLAANTLAAGAFDVLVVA